MDTVAGIFGVPAVKLEVVEKSVCGISCVARRNVMHVPSKAFTSLIRRAQSIRLSVSDTAF